MRRRDADPSVTAGTNNTIISTSTSRSSLLPSSSRSLLLSSRLQNSNETQQSQSTNQDTTNNSVFAIFVDEDCERFLPLFHIHFMHLFLIFLFN